MYNPSSVLDKTVKLRQMEMKARARKNGAHIHASDSSNEADVDIQTFRLNSPQL